MIDGLPFTSKGYNWAKSILVGKYGKSSEVVNAYIQSVMALPTVNSTNPYKIHDFYERLIAHINALDKMGKLKTKTDITKTNKTNINGYVRFTLDKLCGIRADLVRTGDN